MKWVLIGGIALTLMFMFGYAVMQARGEDLKPPELTTMKDARDYIMKNGEDKIQESIIGREKVEIPYKEVKIGGVGQYGAWTFYTFKASAYATKLIVYKPQTMSYVVLVEELSPFGQSSFATYFITDNFSVSWSLWIDSRELMDAFVGAFLDPLPRLILDKWAQKPDPEKDRTDLCWELFDKQQPEQKKEDMPDPTPAPILPPMPKFELKGTPI